MRLFFALPEVPAEAIFATELEFVLTIVGGWLGI